MDFVDNPAFLLSVNGLFKKNFEDAIVDDPVNIDTDSRHDFLFISYVENVLAWHMTRMYIVEDDVKSGILFVLPQSKSILVQK